MAIFLETTVLTNLLLKKDGQEKAVEAKIASDPDVKIAQFAWKEFKRGPLANMIWAHNKLADQNKFEDFVFALERISLTPRKYLTATAIQALHTSFINGLGAKTTTDLHNAFPGEKVSSILADMLRLELRQVIEEAWNKRASLGGGPIDILSCYEDADLEFKKGRLEAKPRDCKKDADCCLRIRCINQKAHLKLARNSISGLATTKTEVANRSAVLRKLEKQSHLPMTPKDCRYFGDAYFVLFCPAGATILSTNVIDIKPMSDALGLKLETP